MVTPTHVELAVRLTPVRLAHTLAAIVAVGVWFAFYALSDTRARAVMVCA
jgi:hypothetical protein